MLGTDQREQFVPTIREALAAGPQRELAILDVGCGDGATFELFADAIPTGSAIDLDRPERRLCRCLRWAAGAPRRYAAGR